MGVPFATNQAAADERNNLLFVVGGQQFVFGDFELLAVFGVVDKTPVKFVFAADRHERH
jgi:hypothetical protein